MEGQNGNEVAPDRALKLSASPRGATEARRIEAACAAVPREPFAGQGLWSILVVGQWSMSHDKPIYVQTPDDDPAFLYQTFWLRLIQAVA
jgi:hypothetical protein